MFGFLYDIIQLDLTAKSARLFKEVSVDYIPHFFGDRSVVADNKHLHFITIGLEFGEGFSGSDVFAHPSTANFLIGEESNL